MTPALPVYRCTSCGAIWSYAAVQHVARCKHCESGLVRASAVAEEPAAPTEAPVLASP